MINTMSRLNTYHNIVRCRGETLSCLLSLFSPVLPQLHSTTSTIINARIYPMMLKLHTIIYRTMNRTQNTEKSRQVSIRNESQCDIYGATSITTATSKLQQNYTSDATYKLLL